MLISFGETYLLIVDEKYSREDFLESFKVKSGSWGEFFANRLFSCLFGNTTNLQEEYRRFYKDEYIDFAIFLEKYYSFSEDTIKIITKKSDSMILCGDYGSEGDYNTAQLIQFNDEIIESINEILAQGVKDEN